MTSGLLGNPVVLHLEVEAVRAEQLAVIQRRVPRLRGLAVEDRGGDVPGKTRAQRDEALVVALQKLVVDARLVVEAFRVAAGS